jgi:hypothetical protein
VRLGPVQLLVVGFDRAGLSGRVLAELERLRDSDAVRVIDLLVVHKDADGVVSRLQDADLTADEAEGAGAVVAALIGLDVEADDSHLAAGEDVWSLDEAIPNGSTAAIALIEHRWAIGTRDAIRAAGGVPVADEWIHPADLAAAGLGDAEDPAPPGG